MEVATARELEAWNKLLRYGCATDDMTALEHSNRESSFSKVGGGRQAIMAGADNKRVPFLLLECANSGCCGEIPSPHFSAS